jgi:hypothetical protein
MMNYKRGSCAAFGIHEIETDRNVFFQGLMPDKFTWPKIPTVPPKKKVVLKARVR